jgi:hypothetical protein
MKRLVAAVGAALVVGACSNADPNHAQDASRAPTSAACRLFPAKAARQVVGKPVYLHASRSDDSCVYVLKPGEFNAAAVRLDVTNSPDAAAEVDSDRADPPDGLTAENLPELADAAFVLRAQDGTEQSVSAAQDGVIYDLGVGPDSQPGSLIPAMREVLRAAKLANN